MSVLGIPGGRPLMIGGHMVSVGAAVSDPTPPPPPPVPTNTNRFTLRDGSYVRLRDRSYASHR